jgi:hypothetical protein
MLDGWKLEGFVDVGWMGAGYLSAGWRKGGMETETDVH